MTLTILNHTVRLGLGRAVPDIYIFHPRKTRQRATKEIMTTIIPVNGMKSIIAATSNTIMLTHNFPAPFCPSEPIETERFMAL